MPEQTSPENQLKGTRSLLIFMGLISCLIIVYRLWNLDMNARIAEGIAQGNLGSPEEQLAFQIIIYGMYALGIGVSLLFVLFGVFTFRFPVICTVGALLVYLAFSVLTLLPGISIRRILFQILVAFVLIQGIRAAFAYKRERKRLAESHDYDDFGSPGDDAFIDEAPRNNF